MSGYIYMIENKINHKKYIGQTSNIKRRERRHFQRLANNNHVNSHLQNSYNKYGENNFNFVILEKNISLENLDNREKFWIKYYDTFKGIGYNMTIGGSSLRGEENPFYGKKHTLKTRNKMSRNHADISGENNPMHKVDFTGKNNVMYGKYGEEHPVSLSNKEEAVQIIKDYYELNLSYNKISKKYNYSESTIFRIINCKHWTTRDLAKKA